MGKCKLIIVASDGLIRLLQFTPIDEFRRSLMYLHYLFCRVFFLVFPLLFKLLISRNWANSRFIRMSLVKVLDDSFHV